MDVRRGSEDFEEHESMNITKLPKWAQARILELENRVATLEGVQNPEKIERDLPPPKGISGLSKGWNFNEHVMMSSYGHAGAVFKACSDCVHHGSGWERTSSQRPIHLFSTELLAWKALRAAVMKMFGEKIAFIDRKIRETEKP